MTDTINDTKIKIKGQKRSTLALLLSLAALGVSGYLYYEGLKLHAQSVYQLQSLGNAAKNNEAQFGQSVAELNNNLVQLQNKVSSLGTDKFSATNYQLNALVSLANQSMVAYHDVNATIKLLSYAKSALEGNDNAIYTELKVAITSDLGKLSQLPILDRVTLATQLNNIIKNTDSLELIDKHTPVESAAKLSAKQSKWQGFISNITIKLSGLVQITSTGNNNALNLLPQNEVIIHQNVKLDILNARMALLQNDEANWQYSLDEAKNNLAVYFVNNVSAQSVANELNQLRQVNISVSDINIDQTLKALNKLNDLSLTALVK